VRATGLISAPARTAPAPAARPVSGLWYRISTARSCSPSMLAHRHFSKSALAGAAVLFARAVSASAAPRLA